MGDRCVKASERWCLYQGVKDEFLGAGTLKSEGVWDRMLIGAGELTGEEGYHVTEAGDAGGLYGAF